MAIGCYDDRSDHDCTRENLLREGRNAQDSHPVDKNRHDESTWHAAQDTSGSTCQRSATDHDHGDCQEKVWIAGHWAPREHPGRSERSYPSRHCAGQPKSEGLITVDWDPRSMRGFFTCADRIRIPSEACPPFENQGEDHG